MRTIEEIRRDIERANDNKNGPALLQYADELDITDSREAVALASWARALASLMMGEYATALEQFERVLPLFEELHDRPGIATILGNIGAVYLHTGYYPLALDFFHRSHDLHGEIGNRAGMAAAISNIGIVHDLCGDFHKALECYRESLAINEEIGNLAGISTAYSNIGAVYSSLGDNPLSLDHHHRALDIYHMLGNESGIAVTLGNIGIIYTDSGDYAAALEHEYRSLSILEKLNDQSGIAYVTSNIGNIYSSLDEFDKALEHYERSMHISETIGARSHQARNIFNMALVQCNLGDYAKALDLARRSIDIHIELGDQSSIDRVQTNLIGILFTLGSVDEAKALLAAIDLRTITEPDLVTTIESQRAKIQEGDGDLVSAVASMKRALDVAEQYGPRDHVAEVHKGLRDLALKQNDLAGYVEHNDAYTRINEEINGKETATKLAVQAKQREIDAREREHAQYMAVLHSTLPQHIAERVAKGEVVNDQYENAAVLFLDIVDFTHLSGQLTSNEVIHLLDTIFTALDAVCKKHDLVKIKTIGDSYMAVAFPTDVPRYARNDSSSDRLPSDESVIPNEVKEPAERAANAALGMLHAVSHIVSPTGSPVNVRLGLHCGALTAGVIGTERLQYDVWGDTVNVASRMESTGEPGRIHVSEAFATFLGHRPRNDISPLAASNQDTVIPNEVRNEESDTWHLALRGETEIKGKGTMNTYWLLPR